MSIVFVPLSPPNYSGCVEQGCLQQNDYLRINAGVWMQTTEEGLKYKDGKIEWSPLFIERVKEWQTYFHELLFQKIVNKIGENGWAIFFNRYPSLEMKMLVDIYVNNPEYFTIIVEVVKEDVPKDFVMQFYQKENIADYIGNN